MKVRVVKPFRDKDTKEDYTVDRVIECEDELAEIRINRGLVERIEVDNHPSNEDSIPSTTPKKGKKSRK